VVGVNNVTVSFAGNNTIEAFMNSSSFNVTKIGTSVSADIVRPVAGSSLVEVNVTDEFGKAVIDGLVTVKDGDVVVGTASIVNGTALISVPTSAGKEYQFTVDYNGTDIYNKSTGITSSKTIQNHTLSIILDNIEPTPVGEQINITGRIVNEYDEPLANTEVNITINGVTYPVVTDENGTFVKPYTTEVTGENNFTVSYEAEGYNDFTHDGNFIVTQLASMINVTATPFVYVGDNTTIKGILYDTNGTPLVGYQVEIIVNNNSLINLTTVEGGIFTYEYTTEIVGLNNVTARYENNAGNYTTCINHTAFYVDKLTSIITVDADTNIKVGNTSIISGLLKDNNGEAIVGATVNVIINNELIGTTVTDNNGAYSYNYTANVVGKNMIVVKFDGNNTITSSDNTTAIIILPYDTNMTIDVDETVLNATVVVISGVLHDENNQPINGTINVYVNNVLVEENLEVSNGQYRVEYITSQVGINTITINYLGDSNHTKSSNTTTFKVITKNVTITMNITGNQTTNTTATINLTDENNQPIPNTNVTVKINNNTYITVTTDENGTVDLPLELPEGNNTIEVIYSGDNQTSPVTINDTVEIAKAGIIITIEPISTVKINETFLINSTITDTNNNYIKEGLVQFTVGNTIIGLVQVTNGTVYYEYQEKLAAVYPVVATYLSNDKYEQVSANTTVEVVKLNTTITLSNMEVTIGDKISIVAQILDEHNKVVTNGKVVFKINGLTMKDENGTVIYVPVTHGLASINLTVPNNWRGSTYNISAVYGGTSNIYISSRSADYNLTVNYKTAFMDLVIAPDMNKMDGVSELAAYVSDKNGIVDGGVVIFKINGETLRDAEGNVIKVEVVNGVAIYNYTLPDGMKARNYNITAVYSNSHYYRAQTNSTLTVVKENIHYNITTDVTGKDVSLKGTILDEHNHTVVGTNKLCIKVDGSTLKDSDSKVIYYYIKNGIINIDFTVPSNRTGTHNIELITGSNYAYESLRQTFTIETS
jgi:hypothetical protein